MYESDEDEDITEEERMHREEQERIENRNAEIIRGILDRNYIAEASNITESSDVAESSSMAEKRAQQASEI